MRGEPVFPDPLDAIGATEFADPREPAIELTARRVSGGTTGKEAARRLFEWVRDEVAYDMAPDLASPREWGAGATLARGSGFCQQKAVLLVALLRARGIPAGIVVQDILDHRITPRYLRLLGSRRFEVHTLACAHLDGRWLRLDPTLDRALVERKGYRLVEFDGESDALLPATDLAGRPHFELIGELGTWLDVSRELMEPVIQSACLRDPEYLELMRRDGPAI